MEYWRGLSVQMLGGFELTFDGKPILLPMKQTAKPVQLLQLLLVAGDAGVSRQRILDSLYMTESEIDAAKSLNVAVSRLRKMLRDCGIPGEKLISVRFDRYFFEAPFPVSVDVEEVERLREAADISLEGDRTSLLYQMCDYYYGRFLPDLDGEEWVEISRARYHRIFHITLEELFSELEKKRAWGEIQRLADFASSLFPYEDWFADMVPIVNGERRGGSLSFSELRNRAEHSPVFLVDDKGIDLVVLKREAYDALRAGTAR